MNREAQIAERLAVGWTQTLSETLPSEVFNIVRRYGMKTQGEILHAVQMQETFQIKLLTDQRGDPARRGSEEGFILAINDQIKPVHKSDPGEDYDVETPRRWPEYRGNNIQLAKFKRVWHPLD